MSATWEILLEQARLAFAERFDGEPAAFGCAPGRVELLGNHTDYNGGLVMAAAIDRFTIAMGRRSRDRKARVCSVNFGQSDAFPVDAIEQTAEGEWTRYVRGVCWSLAQWRGPITAGFAATMLGDVPLGAGLSSSASLQASVAWFAIQIGLVPGRSARNRAPDRVDLSLMELAQVLRRSENEFVGVGSGVLDQFASLFGRADHALFLDCDSLRMSEFLSVGPRPRSWSATPKRRAGWRMACITGDGQSAIESRAHFELSSRTGATSRSRC